MTSSMFACIASGTFHQGNAKLFPVSHNKQCVANSTCALAWKTCKGEFTSAAIDGILYAGDRLYRQLRTGNEKGYMVYLEPEEVPNEIEVLGQNFRILEIANVFNALWPLSRVDFDNSVTDLSHTLRALMADDNERVGYLFTGQTVTVSFWRLADQLFLFDPHPVNESRKYDFKNFDKNLSRLFSSHEYVNLAHLLLNNAALDGVTRQYSIHRLTFGQNVEPDLHRTQSANSVCMEIEEANRHAFQPDLQQIENENSVQMEIEQEMNTESETSNVKSGRKRGQKKRKRGRPKTSSTTREEQIREAKKRYSEKNREINREAVKRYSVENPEVNRSAVKKYQVANPDVHREAVKKYNEANPDVHREAVKKYNEANPDVHREAVKKYNEANPGVHIEAAKKYNEANPDVHREAVKKYNEANPGVHIEAAKKYNKTNPDVHREASKKYNKANPDVVSDVVKRFNEAHPEANRENVQRYRAANPTLNQLRHISKPIARVIVDKGPMAYWQEDLLDKIPLYQLKKTCLREDGVHECRHCGARFFEEEKERKKWCCGEGSYNILQLAPLDELFYKNREFIQRARAYNDMFAFSALEVSGAYRHPSGLAFFKIEGHLYHQVYNLNAPGQRFSPRGGVSQFLNHGRLYIDDGAERKNIAEGRKLNPNIIDDIRSFMERKNPFVSEFKRLSEEPSVSAHLDFQVTNRATHGPTLGDRNRGVEVHAVLSTDETVSDKRNITIWKIGEERPTSIDLFSPLMEPFQYPLLFPEGTPCWHIGRSDNKGKKLSQFDYSRCLLLSESRFSHLGRLSQAWQVEMFARFEEERLRFIKRAQEGIGNMRMGPLDELVDASRGRQVITDIERDETVAGEGGAQPGKIYLPCTFTGGPRYMKVHYENAMGLVARKGPPTYFLTFTHSARWKEHKEACPHGSGLADPATACRIFKLKLQEMLRDLRSGAMFGRTTYIVYVIEMQMRGLPHAHIVFKVEGDSPAQANQIDSVIRADIPSEDEAGGRLRELVLQNMIHGPCGTNYRTDFACWDSAKGYCTKMYPKPAVVTTHSDERGFVQYRRDYNNKGVIKTRNKEIEVHDGWVVPYNAALLLKYEAHINLELASTRRVIKYLFKYLMKGGSLQNVTVTPFREQEDEVKHYVTKRMVGASDACWRLLDFDLSRSEPTIDCLPVHLDGKQTVFFRSSTMDEAIEKASSKLVRYFERPNDAVFDDLTYQSFYENYIIHTTRPSTKKETIYECADGRHFLTARQRGEKVCRLIWVSPCRGEQYYLRLLLMRFPCRGFSDLLSLGGPGCSTFQEVARKKGLIDDEREYHHAIEEASQFMVGRRLRAFFVLLCNMGAPAAILWEHFRNVLSEDHLERNPLDPELAYKLSLIEIDRSLRRQGSCLTDHGLPFVEDDTTELGRELLTYGERGEQNFVDEWSPRLSPDQNNVFIHVKSLIEENADQARVIFLDGPGGYGKTQLIKVILSYVRSLGHVALAVASSGIAAGNMPGGTTAHSMFRIPLDLGQGTGVWNVTNGSQRAELIRAARLIIFDEAPMAHRYVFEMLDRSLRDLMNCRLPFGGKIFLCSGDFRQIAPVVVRARTPEDIVVVSLRSSPLWAKFKVFHLITPQRTSGCPEYSEFLLKVGNGTVPIKRIHEENLIALSGVRHLTSLEELIADVFPTDFLNDSDQTARRAIFAPLNVNVKAINTLILESLDGPFHELLSADKTVKEDDDGIDVDIQIMNQATGPGIPDHVLRLKIGCVCLIMRNLNIADGLVNGTKVIVTAISRHLVTVRLPGGTERFAIPRITFKFPVVEGSPLQISRRQFPLTLAYAMSGHKSQGQTIEYAGVDLRTDCFTHGQLYVLLSRVRSPDNIVVLVPEERVHKGKAYVKNIVYEQLLL